MAEQDVELPARRGVPDPRRAVLTGGRDHGPIGTERNLGHVAFVPSQPNDGLARGGPPDGGAIGTGGREQRPVGAEGDALAVLRPRVPAPHLLPRRQIPQVNASGSGESGEQPSVGAVRHPTDVVVAVAGLSERQDALSRLDVPDDDEPRSGFVTGQAAGHRRPVRAVGRAPDGLVLDHAESFLPVPLRRRPAVPP